MGVAIFQPLFWLGWIFSIFGGFTFTDLYDFIPLACLLGGLLGAGVSGLRVLRPASWWFKGLLALLALWPLYPSTTLLMLALQVVKAHSAWPQVMVDDPKGLAGMSPAYDFWFHATAYAEAIAGAVCVSFGALLYANKQRLSEPMRWILLGICGSAMLVSIVDPGHLTAWWLD